MVIDLIKQEVKDTYIIGANASLINVSAITTDGVNLIASAIDGVYYAPLSNPNLANYAVWDKYNLPGGEYSDVCYANNKIYALFRLDVHDTIFMNDGNGWDRLGVNEYDDVKFLDVAGDYLVVGAYSFFDTYDANNSLNYHIYDYGFASL